MVNGKIWEGRAPRPIDAIEAAEASWDSASAYFLPLMSENRLSPKDDEEEDNANGVDEALNDRHRVKVKYLEIADGISSSGDLTNALKEVQMSVHDFVNMNRADLKMTDGKILSQAVEENDVEFVWPSPNSK